MSVLGEVFGSLKSMSQLQLLLAFIVCIGYAFAQGSLLPAKGRRVACITAAGGATGFAFESTDWTQATMLLGFAIAGLGGFVALVWLTSRALGFGRAAPRVDAATAEPTFGAAAPQPLLRAARSTEHAHSV